MSDGLSQWYEEEAEKYEASRSARFNANSDDAVYSAVTVVLENLNRLMAPSSTLSLSRYHWELLESSQKKLATLFDKKD